MKDREAGITELYRLSAHCFDYWESFKKKSPEADTQREAIIKESAALEIITIKAIKEMILKWQQADDEQQQILSDTEWFNPAVSLGSCFYTEALVKGKTPATILKEAEESAIRWIIQTHQEFKESPFIIDDLAHVLISETVRQHLLTTQDMRAKQRIATKKFQKVMEETREKLVRGEITQEQADQIYTVTTIKIEGSNTIDHISPGPGYGSMLDSSIQEQYNKLSQLYIGTLEKRLHVEATKGKLELRSLDLASTEVIDVGYFPMYQGPGINALTRIHINKNKASAINAYGDYTFKLDAYKYELVIKQFESLSFSNVSADQLLKMALLKLTQANGYRATPDQIKPEITIPLDEYMKLRGIPQTSASYKKTRLTIKEDLETFKRMWISWEENGKDKAFGSMVVCQDNNYKNGLITFTFGNKVAHYLINAYTMQFPTALFKIKGNSPNAYRIGCKLALHNSMDSNKRRGTDNILSVESLLKEAPEIPTYIEVMDGDRHAERRIIDPLERALDTLCSENVLTSWEYCNKKREPLAKQQIDSGSYSDFSKWYVHFELKNAPDQSERIEKKTKEKTDKKKADAKRKDRALQKVADRAAENEANLKGQIAMEEL